MSQDSFAAVSLQEGYLLYGHYKILSVLGRGGFSFTYKAQDKHLERFVVVKEYFPASLAARSGLSVSPIDANSREAYADGLQSFIKEAQTLTKFRNEHICSVLDYFQENGTAYFVMPYILGESLELVLKKCPGGMMSCVAVRKWFLPLLDALDEVHKNSYIHRDIKPSNIYISHDGKPILIDFGAARTSLGRTHGYTVVLTPEYAPPEQSTTDISAQGPWTDIYAMGAVVCRSLLGTPPPDAQKRVLAKVSGEPDPLDDYLSLLKVKSDEKIYKFIIKALRLTPSERFQSVDEVKLILDIDTDVNMKFTFQAINKEADNNLRFKINVIAIICIIIFAFLVFGNLEQDQTMHQTAKYSNNQNQTTYHTVKYGNDELYKMVSKHHDKGINDYKTEQFYNAVYNFTECLSYENSDNSQRLLEKQATCANYLAVMYSTGKGGLPEDQFKAFKLLTFSARLGNRSAQYNLAKRYKNGVGTRQDTQLAVHWYTQAANSGDIDAAKVLGGIYEKGLGNVRANSEAALSWYKYAYSLNSRDTSVNEAIKRLEKGER